VNLTTRIKKSKAMIRLVRPIEVNASNLIYPIFIREDGKSFGIPSIRGQNYLSLDGAVDVCHKAVELGIPAVMIFGVLKEKNEDGSIALHNDFHRRVFRRLKKELGEDLVLISNICLCEYTTQEFCVYSENGKVLNEKTAEMLAKIAVIHAKAGADVVAPSAMCDGQVRYMRSALDAAGLEDVPVMSYFKTDTCLFQPFFEAITLSDAPRVGVDSSKFRADIINEKMFMQKVDLDVSEGADMLIVKPALTNLDLILRVKQKYPTLPLAAYQVSGEYAMINLLAEHAHVNQDAFLMETLSSIRRAGADMILSYYALEATDLLTKA
jgi:porphobilinogen synthase